MWLTGFDAPSMNTMYVDKKMQGANLMQAIARVNRVYKDKPGGLIVDYIGIGQELRNAMGTYLQSGGEGKAFVDIREAIALMQEKFEIVEQMFHGFDSQGHKYDHKGLCSTVISLSSFAGILLDKGKRRL